MPAITEASLAEASTTPQRPVVRTTGSGLAAVAHDERSELANTRRTRQRNANSERIQGRKRRRTWGSRTRMRDLGAGPANAMNAANSPTRGGRASGTRTRNAPRRRTHVGEGRTWNVGRER